jgi:hypothetical protein
MLKHVVELYNHLSQRSRTHGWTNPWHYPQNPLMKSHGSVSDFCSLPVFFWVPELLYPKFLKSTPCPKCDGKVVMDGWNPKGPRLVASPRPYWIMTKNHECKGCKTLHCVTVIWSLNECCWIYFIGWTGKAVKLFNISNNLNTCS